MSVICLILGSSAAAFALKKKWIDVAPCFVMGVMIMTYVLMIIMGGELYFVKYFKFFMTVIAIIMIVIAAKVREKSFLYIIKNTIGKSEIYFFIYLLIIFICFRSHSVIDWDDVSHWALFPKQLFYINRIPINGESISNYSDYLPIQSLFFYWFESDFKYFHDGILFMSWWGLIGLNCSFIWEKISSHNSQWKNALLILSGLMLPAVISNFSFINLKVDGLVGIMFIEILLSIFSELSDERYIIDKWLIIKRGILLSFIVLLKSTTLYMIIICLIINLILVISKYYNKYFTLMWKITTVLGMYLFAFALRKSWSRFCIVNQLSSYISTGFSGIRPIQYIESLSLLVHTIPIYMLYGIIILLVALFYGYSCRNMTRNKHFIVCIVCLSVIVLWTIKAFMGADDYRYGNYKENAYQVSAHYWNELSTKAIGFQFDESSNWGVPFTVCFAMIVFILLTASNFVKEKKMVLLSFATLFIGMIFYMTGHLALYLYLFSENETAILSAFSRYIIMYFAAFFVYPLFILLNCTKDYAENNKSEIIFSYVEIICLLVVAANLHFAYICFSKNNEYISQLSERKMLVDYIYQTTIDEYKNGGGTILWIGEADVAQISHLVTYEYCPYNVSVDYRTDLPSDFGNNTYYIVADDKDLCDLKEYSLVGEYEKYYIYRR